MHALFCFLSFLTLCVVSRRFLTITGDVKGNHVCIKYCFKLGKTAVETLWIVLTSIFCDDAVGRTQSFDWFSLIKMGQTSAEDDKRSGRSSTSKTPENVEKVRRAIHEDRRQTPHASLQYCGTVLQDVSHFVRWTEHETDCCQIRGQAADWWPESTAHAAVAVQQFLASDNRAVVPHPPYSHDLAPCDFFLLSKMKLQLKGQKFNTVEVQAE